MNKDVIISVKGNQHYENDNDCIELITHGKYYKNGDEFIVTYNETEMTGMEGTTTKLTVKNDVVTLMRFGENNSQLVFQKGQKHLGYYETPYGAFTVGIKSSSLKIDLDENGGEIKALYSLEIDNQRAGENDFCLKIREACNSNDKPGRNGKKTNRKGN